MGREEVERKDLVRFRERDHLTLVVVVVLWCRGRRLFTQITLIVGFYYHFSCETVKYFDVVVV